VPVFQRHFAIQLVPLIDSLVVFKDRLQRLVPQFVVKGNREIQKGRRLCLRKNNVPGNQVNISIFDRILFQTLLGPLVKLQSEKGCLSMVGRVFSKHKKSDFLTLLQILRQLFILLLSQAHYLLPALEKIIKILFAREPILL
jgi:hypothetical protein